ncbi:MAG TPA: ATP-dependent DNA helicase [Candidatus Dormibacteraeota bacterium]
MLGPTRVVGGPQSGKTQVLVDLAVEWLRAGNEASGLVLVVRSHAAGERLAQRIEAALPEAHPALEVHTHERLAGMVLERLRQVPRSRRVLSRTGEWLAMREALRRAGPSLPHLGPLVEEPSTIDDAIGVVSACKRALVGPGLLAERLRLAPDSLREIAVIAAIYEDVLAEMHARDARDGHGLALDALAGDSAALRNWADLLLVDDAEDLSPAQWLLLRELADRLSPPRRLVMAGHGSLSTPGFRGVSSESSSRPFEEYFPSELGARDWSLPPVLPGWADQVAEGLGLDLEVDRQVAPAPALEPLPEAAFRLGLRVEVWRASDETEEALAVAREIVRARLADEAAFGEVAILLRSPGRQLAPIRAALSTLGVPSRLVEVNDGLGQPAVAVVLNWLRALARPFDAAILLEALGTGPGAVSQKALRALQAAAGRRGFPLTRIFWDWAEEGAGDGDAPEAKAEAREWERLQAVGRSFLDLQLNGQGLARQRLTWSQVRSILSRVELASGLASAALRDQKLALQLAGFAVTAAEVADAEARLGHDDLPLGDWVDLLQMAARRAPGEQDREGAGERSEVTVMGIRQAKGRHWRRVFLCGCVAGTLPAPPDTGGLLGADEVQELVRCLPELEDVVSAGDRQRDAESRLFLVGLTRATSLVTCTAAARYQGRPIERSPYVEVVRSAGIAEIAAPLAELVHSADLITELALAVPPPEVGVQAPQLARAAARLRLALTPWDPVEGGPVELVPPLSLSATSVAAWLACPRQYLAHQLRPASDTNVNLTVGSQAHRLLELLYLERTAWQGDPVRFREAARRLIQERLMPAVRAEHPDALDVHYVGLWLERMAARWESRIVAPGPGAVGEPLAAEVSFDLPRQGWRLQGKVDSLWRHANGELELLDYKTGAYATDGHVRGEVFGDPPGGPRNWQLPIYQIAARAGGLGDQLGLEVPALVRNWYVGVNPGPRDPDPIATSGFRMVEQGEAPGGSGTLTEQELDRIESALDEIAEAILSGRFPAQPRHDQRTCRGGRSECPVSFWCDGEGSVGRAFPRAGQEL